MSRQPTDVVTSSTSSGENRSVPRRRLRGLLAAAGMIVSAGMRPAAAEEKTSARQPTELSVGAGAEGPTGCAACAYVNSGPLVSFGARYRFRPGMFALGAAADFGVSSYSPRVGYEHPVPGVDDSDRGFVAFAGIEARAFPLYTSSRLDPYLLLGAGYEFSSRALWDASKRGAGDARLAGALAGRYGLGVDVLLSPTIRLGLAFTSTGPLQGKSCGSTLAEDIPGAPVRASCAPPFSVGYRALVFSLTFTGVGGP